MSQYYKPHRNPRWNFNPNEKNNYKLSRSRLELFIGCPRCFYMDNRLGTARPPGYPFGLNSAVDGLLKKEFDLHRAKGTKHPLMKHYKIKAVPFKHVNMDQWRENFVGVQCHHQETGLTIMGAVDDIWINDKKELIVVDYKATSKPEKITALDQEWQISYKRQMEIYQWLLRQNGHKVSNTGYFVYCNGITDKEAFDGKLEFDITLIPYEGNDAWVDRIIKNAYKCLTSDKIPAPSDDCDYCKYRKAIKEVIGL